MPINLRKKQYVNVTPGIHQATLSAVIDLGFKDYGEGKGPQPMLRLHFMVDQNDASGQPLVVGALCTQSLELKSKLYQYVLALNDGVVPDALTIDNFVGRKCQLLISHRTGNDGRIWDQIDSILPPIKTANTTTQDLELPTTKQ